MDIFEQARTMDADYLDMATGYIYHIQQYNRCKKLGLPNLYGGILVTDSCTGEIIGVVREEENA